MADNKRDWLKVFTSIFKEVGLVGFIVIICTWIFIWYGSEDQKKEFIDKFILLKDDNPYYCALIIVFLVAIIIIGGTYSSKMAKLRKNENNRLGEEKSNLQSMLLGKKLNSSDED